MKSYISLQSGWLHKLGSHQCILVIILQQKQAALKALVLTPPMATFNGSKVEIKNRLACSKVNDTYLIHAKFQI